MQKLVVIDIDSILRLLTHYFDGEVPLDAEAREFGYSQYFPRWLQIVTESKEWDTSRPLQLRFEGGKVLRIDEAGVDPQWTDAPDAPRKQ